MDHLARSFRAAVCLAFLVAAAIAVVPGPASATAAPGNLLFASPTGSGLPNECSQTRPCPLQTALTQAASGDRIYALAGVYTGTGDQVLLIDKSVQIWGGWDGQPGEAVAVDPQKDVTILDGQSQRRVVFIAAGASPFLFGLTIQNGKTLEFGGGIRVESGSTGDITINLCKIANNVADSYGGGIYLPTGSLEVTRTTLAGNAAVYGGGAIYAGLTSSLTVQTSLLSDNSSQYGSAIHADRANLDLRRNLITGNASSSDPASDCVGVNGANGVSVQMDNNIIANNNCTAVQTINPGLNLSIRHNTITGNSQAGILFGAAATGEVFNNIIAGQGADGLYTATGSSVAVSHNLFWKNASVTSPGMNAVIADPLLSADGHLMRGSPAVNAGFLTPLDVDFDGDLRPIAGLPDIGADEQLLATFLPVAMR